jgi:ribonuclease HI
MISQLARLRVRPTLVRGHAGHDANERADRLAQEAARDAEPAPPPAPPPTDAPPPRVDGQLGLDV